MTKRPEFVPVFLQSATDIKEFLLSQIPDTWRKEVGDFPYDMIMPDVAQVMQLEIAQDTWKGLVLPESKLQQIKGYCLL